MGEKALALASAIDLTLTSRNVGLPERVPMVGIPYHALEAYLEKLKKKNIDYVVGDSIEELEAALKQASAQEAVAEQERRSVQADPSPIANFMMREEDFVARPPLQRINDNIEAIKLVKRLTAEKRQATQEEKTTIAKYVGWGGLSEVFDDRKQNFAKARDELRTLLSAEEYADARASTLSAFYTDKAIIDGIYAGLERLGVKDARILEPSCGTGNFIGCAPKNNGYKFDAVELDSISAQIAKILYPEARIINKGYEEVAIADGTYNAVVGNVPFGNFSVNDPVYNRYNFPIHDYFLAKSIDKLRAGGIMAAITSSGTMDKADGKLRRYLAERAELIAAFRLPNTAFKGNANTEAVTDLLFFQKRDERSIITKEEWLNSQRRDEYTDDALNDYFVDHPENVLGEFKTVSGRYGYARTVAPHEGDFKAELMAAINRLPQNIYTATAESVLSPDEHDEAEEQECLENGERNFDFCIRKGKIFVRFNNTYETPSSKLLQGNVGEKRLEQIQAYIALREQALKIIDIQVAGCSDGELSSAQALLHNFYDDYVKKYGYLSSPKNASLLKDDNDYSVVAALEDYDKETNTAQKTSIFSQRTLRKAERKTRADDIFEGLTLCRSYLGRIDVQYIAKLTEQNADTVIEKLDGEIYQDITIDFLTEPNEELRYENFKTRDEFLSGNVVKKLADCRKCKEYLSSDKLILSEEEKALLLTRLGKNEKALEAIQPKKLTRGDIHARIGVTWIEENDYWHFFEHLAGQRVYKDTGDGVHYSKINGEYFFHAPSHLRYITTLTTKWGTTRMSGVDLFACALNNQTPTVYDKKITDGKEERILNKAETMLAREKLRAMQEEFSTWLWENPLRVEKYEKIYNERFNNTVLPEYHGEHITFDGMNETISLRDHQRAAVERISTGQNVLLHHSVGAGKTYEMIAGAKKLREYGIAAKPMFVVPNAIIGQWAKDAKTLYPNSKVLVANKEDFEKNRRKQFISKIATGDWDMVIIADSQFIKIPVSLERQLKKLEEQKTQIELSLRDSKERQWGSQRSLTTKSLESAKKRCEAKTKEILDKIQKRKDNTLSFEQLGVDYLFIDEAHGYKNKELITHMSNVAGISSNGSQKAFDLDMKIDYLRELHGGDRGVVFATGTPISNSMAEMYTMQTYLGKEALRYAGIEFFDAWASTFGETVTGWELKASGDGVKQRTRFARFVNLPELQMMYRTFADVKTADMLNLPVPSVERHTVTLAPTEQIREYNDLIVKRGELIDQGRVDPKQDNMLKLTSDGKKLALDARCYDKNAHDDEDTKVNACIRNVVNIYKKTSDKRLTQVIFCDQSTPKENNWSIYGDIKEKLVAFGIPDEEIAFIHDAKNDAEKRKLFEALNAGKIRVLIGSTMKCGTGANFQKKLKALHHLDVPYRPSDMEQREGRIIRQGNENKEVEIYSYITERTFDSYSYQILESKQRFISQINRGDMTLREAADIDETTLSYSQIKAIATANPDFLKQMQLIQSLKELQMLKSKHFEEQQYIKHKLDIALPQSILKETAKKEALTEDLKNFTETPSLSLGDKALEKFGDEESELFTQAFASAKTGDEIGMINGKQLIANKEGGWHGCVIIRGSMDYNVNLGDSGRGNLQRIINLYLNLPKELKDTEANLLTLQNELDECKKQIDKPFAREEELKAQEKELDEINRRLRVNDDDVVDESEEISVPQELIEEQKERCGSEEAPENGDEENERE